jgi:hypothetical protein
MLSAGWPVDTRGEMGAAALHWAALNANGGMTREILGFHPTLELKSREQESALGWAIFGSGIAGSSRPSIRPRDGRRVKQKSSYMPFHRDPSN